MEKVDIFRNLVDMEVTYAEMPGMAVKISKAGEYYIIRVEEVGEYREYVNLYLYNRDEGIVIQREEV